MNTTIPTDVTMKPATRRLPNTIRAIAADIALNVVLPYVAYAALREAGQTEASALVLSTLPPVAVAVFSIFRRGRLNALSLLMIGATGLSLLATALSGSAWFALVRSSFITLTLALVFAASLLAERPTLFYLARDTTCPTAEAASAFEANWVRPRFRTSMRRLTLVWAAFLAGEALVRLVIAAFWPSQAVVAATHILWIVLPVLLTSWSIKAGRRWASAPTPGV